MGGDRREQPGQLGVLAHVGLAEEDAALGVEAGGEQDRGRVVDALAQLGRVVGDRDRVQVDDAEDRRLAAVLALDVLADRADVVAEVLAAGRLDAGEDDRGGASSRRSLCGARRRSLPSSRGASAPCPHSRRAAPRLGLRRLARGSRSRSRRRCRRRSSARRRSGRRGGRPRSRRRRRRRRTRARFGAADSRFVPGTASGCALASATVFAAAGLSGAGPRLASSAGAEVGRDHGAEHGDRQQARPPARRRC